MKKICRHKFKTTEIKEYEYTKYYNQCVKCDYSFSVYGYKKIGT